MNDFYTSRYIVLYTVIVGLCLLLIVTGSMWLSRTPLFSLTFLVSALKEPFYKAEFYLEERNGLANALTSQKVTVFAESGNAVSVPVLMYHGVLKEPDETADVTIAQFKDHMYSLKRAGYTTISLDDFLAFIQGERELPARSILITFDDGRRDSFYNGGPILSALDFTAVMYVIGMFTEVSPYATGVYYLSERETAMMARSETWEVGSHSYNGHREIAQNADGTDLTYFFGGRMWLPERNDLESFGEFRARVAVDLRRSKDLLEKTTETPIKTLAFPFGNYGELTAVTDGVTQIKDIVLTEAGDIYELMFYQNSPQQYFTQAYPALDPDGRDRKLVRRITVTDEMDGETLVKLLEHGAAKSAPFEASFTEDDGWVEAWGSMSVANGKLTLDAEGRGAGAAAILDGTRHWVDYRIDAEVTSQEGSSVVLLMRHDSQGDTVACNFGKNFVHINQVVIGGAERVIRGTDAVPVLTASSTPIHVVAEVSGRTMRCYLNGALMVETEFLDPRLDHGGVGFKTWNPTENARITIHSFSATPLESEAQ